jgi:hypothetical protein
VRERNYFEDLSTDGRVILKWIFEKGMGVYRAQDRDMWPDFVGAVMNLRFP